MGQHRTGDESCPVCGSHFESIEEKLGELRASLKELELEAGNIFEIPAAFDREMQRVQIDVSEATDKLKAIQIRKRALSQRSEDASVNQYQAKKVERFIGNLENALRLHEKLGEDAELRTELVQLREQTQQLAEELQRENLEDRKQRALRIVNNNAAHFVPQLDCERPDDCRLTRDR